MIITDSSVPNQHRVIAACIVAITHGALEVSLPPSHPLHCKAMLLTLDRSLPAHYHGSVVLPQPAVRLQHRPQLLSMVRRIISAGKLGPGSPRPQLPNMATRVVSAQCGTPRPPPQPAPRRVPQLVAAGIIAPRPRRSCARCKMLHLPFATQVPRIQQQYSLAVFKSEAR
jgi:hypothetical protein